MPGSELRKTRAARASEPAWLRRVLGLGLSGLMVVWIAYVTAANLFLNLGGLERLLRTQDDIALRFDVAFTYWPGEVHLRGYRMVFQDTYVEWSLDLPSGIVVVDLTALAERRFRARSVRGSGAVFRFRHKIDPRDAELGSTRALPPIPEFGRAPLSQAGAPAPPIEDAEYRLWAVRLDDVDVRLAELWIQQVRYVGAARVRGGFELRPMRTLWVGPASLELEGGRLLVGDVPLAAALTGAVSCTMPRFDVREPEGRSILRHVSGTVALRASGVRAEPAAVFVTPGHEVAIESQPGDLRAKVRVERGVLDKEAEVELTQPFLALSRNHFVFHASKARLLARGLPGGQAEVVVEVALLELGAKGADSPGPRADAVRLGARTSSRDAAGEWTLVRAHLDAQDVRVPDLAWLNTLIHPGTARFERSGSAELEVAAAVSDSAVTLAAKGTADRVRLRAGALRVGGAGAFEFNGQGDRSLGRAHTVTRLDLRGLAFEQAGSDAHCAVARVNRARVVSEVTLREGALDAASVTGRLDDASLRSGRVRGRVDVSFDADLRERQGAEPRLLVTNASLSRLELDDGETSPRRVRVRIPEATLSARVTEREGVLSGAIELGAKRTRLRVGTIPAALDLHTKLALERIEPASKKALLGASLRIRNATTSVDGSKVEGYWANVDLGRVRIGMNEELELDGSFSARLRDGVPGLLLLEHQDQVPGWLEELLPMRALRVHGRIERRCRITDFRLESASGGPLEARGRLQATPRGTRGALLVTLSGLEAVSAGLSFGVPDPGVELSAGEGWLEERSLGLERRLRSARQTACAPIPPACSD